MLQVKSGGKVLWLMIVLASLAVATVFIRASIQVQQLLVDTHTRHTSLMPMQNAKPSHHGLFHERSKSRLHSAS